MAGVSAAALGWVVKDGRDPGEYEDSAVAGNYRFAVADGASDSARAEVWADLLVYAFVREQVDPFDAGELNRLRHLWRGEVYRPGLPWHALSKLALGGAATFLGVSVDPDQTSYSVTALGDSCLLHLRAGLLVTGGPVDGSTRFGRKPACVKSTFEDDSFHNLLWRFTIPYKPGDVLILATDALSKYLLRCHEQNRKLDVESHLDTNEAFGEWVVHARAHDGLENDDTTICVVRL